MKTIRKVGVILCLAALSTLLSCNQNRLYKSFEAPTGMTWKKTEPFTYSVDVAENTPAKLMLELRHLSSIKYGQLTVQLKHTLPSGTEETATYLLQIRQADGTLIGEAMGDYCDTPCLLEENTVLEAGMHTFVLSHQMEEDDLSGFMEVGLIIDKIEGNSTEN